MLHIFGVIVIPVLEVFGVIVGSGLIVKSLRIITSQRETQGETQREEVASSSTAPQPQKPIFLVVQTRKGHIENLKQLMTEISNIPNLSPEIERVFHNHMAKAEKQLAEEESNISLSSQSLSFSANEIIMIEKYKIAQLIEISEEIKRLMGMNEGLVTSGERVRDLVNEKIKIKKQNLQPVRSPQQGLGPRAGELSTSQSAGASSSSTSRFVGVEPAPPPIGVQNPNGGGGPWSWISLLLGFALSVSSLIQLVGSASTKDDLKDDLTRLVPKLSPKSRKP